jgi:hypothetical protein
VSARPALEVLSTGHQTHVEPCAAGCGAMVRFEGPTRDDGSPRFRPTCESCLAAWESRAKGTKVEAGPPAERWQVEMAAAGIPVRAARGITLDGWVEVFRDRAAWEAVREFAGRVVDSTPYQFQRGLYLAGTEGTGKTMASFALIRWLVEEKKIRGETLRWERFGSFLRRVQDAYTTGGAEELVRSRKRARLWVIDDLGKEKPTEHALGVLEDILDERQGETMVTSNLGLVELGERYGSVPGVQTLVSRFGPAQFDHVSVRGPDRRFG